jgi:nitrate reductase gamma subunit
MGGWILAGAICGVFLLFAGWAWLIARRTRPRRVRRPMHSKIMLVILIGGIFAVYALVADSELRQTTLDEEIMDGPSAEAFERGDTVRVVEFVVEPPGVEHKLMIEPTHRVPTYWKGHTSSHCGC